MFHPAMLVYSSRICCFTPIGSIKLVPGKSRVEWRSPLEWQRDSVKKPAPPTGPSSAKALMQQKLFKCLANVYKRKYLDDLIDLFLSPVS